MKRPSARVALSLSLSLGCAAQLSARPGAVSASVRGDARAAAAIGAGLSLLAEGASASSRGASSTAVHTPSRRDDPEPDRATVSAPAVPAATTGRAAATEPPQAPSAVIREVHGSASAATRSVPTGVVDGALQRARIGGGADVLGGGGVRLDGAPMVDGLRVIDGRLDPRTPLGGTSTASSERSIEVSSGTILLEDREGRRWRARVERGALRLRTTGVNPQGLAVWTATDATLRLQLTSQGDARLTLHGDAPTTPAAGSPVALPPRVMAALDALILAAPEGSVEALRLASAVQVAIRRAEGADPAVYSVPVRGRSLALLLDVSYSMRDLDPAAVWFELGPEARPTKLDVARAELVKVLASLPEGTSVNLISFSTRARSIWTAPRTIDAASLDEAIRWLVALRPADETHPAEAIELAASMRPEQIVMISDGRPSGDAEDGRGLLGFVQGISSRTRLDVVGVGPDQDREFLAALALHGRGSLRVR